MSPMCREPYSKRLQYGEDALFVRHMPDVSDQESGLQYCAFK